MRVCPNKNSPEWKILVQEEGSNSAAYQRWVGLGHEFPTHIIRNVNSEGLEVDSSEKQVIPDAHLLKKVALVKKSKRIVQKKIERIGRILNKGEHLETTYKKNIGKLCLY